MKRASFRVFQSFTKSWAELFQEVAEFAGQLGPERVISISHSEDSNEGVAVVWFWETSA